MKRKKPKNADAIARIATQNIANQPLYILETDDNGRDARAIHLAYNQPQAAWAVKQLLDIAVKELNEDNGGTRVFIPNRGKTNESKRLEAAIAKALREERFK